MRKDRADNHRQRIKYRTHHLHSARGRDGTFSRSTKTMRNFSNSPVARSILNQRSIVGGTKIQRLRVLLETRT